MSGLVLQLEKCNKYTASSITGLTKRLKQLECFIESGGVIQQHHSLDDVSLNLLLNHLVAMDSNNHPNNHGLGEREGRVLNENVKKRYFGLSHGIGRSGDVNALQPKAAGSSLIVSMVRKMGKQIVQLAGVRSVKDCLVVPMCTGMSLSLVMQTLRWERRNAKYVIWPRIDQKTCLKCIVTAGFEPIIIQGVLEGDSIHTNLDAIEMKIKESPESILCVLSTSSCFAPRQPDNVVEIAKICAKYKVPHVINNAYGIQSIGIMNAIERSIKIGRVDAFVSSTDKNFLVPVGGAVICSPDKKFIGSISQMYSGRASMSPLLDLFITFSQSSQQTWKTLWKDRQTLMNDFLIPELDKILETNGERRLACKNPISIAFTLDQFDANCTAFGGMLYSQCITGLRVVRKSTKTTICSIDFEGFGSHCDDYPHHYAVLACSIGITKENIESFLDHVKKCFKKLHHHHA